jgi:hypothetical protein
MAGGCHEVSPPQHMFLAAFTIYIAKDNSPTGVLPSHAVLKKKQDSHAYVEVVPHLSHESSLYRQFFSRIKMILS